MCKVLSINTSDGLYNIMAVDKDGNHINLKISSEASAEIKIGHVYIFTYDVIEGVERVTNKVSSFTKIMDMPYEQKNDSLRCFYPQAPINLKDAQKEIFSYVNKIENNIIRQITNNLIEKYKEDFFLYPAASKLHHAYVGGLAYHSIGMCHLADGFIENYPYLNKDYVYAGILLHDIGKTIELTGVINTEYSLRGQLIGHLVLGAMEIEKEAIKLGYADSEEALMLEHMLISHHGQPMFGSAKKPMTPEALVLWYIDTIDSKFRVLGEELEKTKNGSFTENIGVLDRQKIYKI